MLFSPSFPSSSLSSRSCDSVCEWMKVCVWTSEGAKERASERERGGGERKCVSVAALPHGLHAGRGKLHCSSLRQGPAAGGHRSRLSLRGHHPHRRSLRRMPEVRPYPPPPNPPNPPHSPLSGPGQHFIITPLANLCWGLGPGSSPPPWVFTVPVFQSFCGHSVFRVSEQAAFMAYCILNVSSTCCSLIAETLNYILS